VDYVEQIGFLPTHTNTEILQRDS